MRTRQSDVSNVPGDVGAWGAVFDAAAVWWRWRWGGCGGVDREWSVVWKVLSMGEQRRADGGLMSGSPDQIAGWRAMVNGR